MRILRKFFSKPPRISAGRFFIFCPRQEFHPHTHASPRGVEPLSQPSEGCALSTEPWGHECGGVPVLLPSEGSIVSSPAHFLCPHEESNLGFSLRRAALYPLSYGDKMWAGESFSAQGGSAFGGNYEGKILEGERAALHPLSHKNMDAEAAYTLSTFPVCQPQPDVARAAE